MIYWPLPSLNFKKGGLLALTRLQVYFEMRGMLISSFKYFSVYDSFVPMSWVDLGLTIRKLEFEHNCY